MQISHPKLDEDLHFFVVLSIHVLDEGLITLSLIAS